MDSLMGVEIKQIMETQYNIDMSLPNIRKLTIQNLREMSGGRGGGKTSSDVNLNEVKEVNANTEQLEIEQPGLFTIPMESVVQLSAGKEDHKPIILLHDLDGMYP